MTAPQNEWTEWFHHDGKGCPCVGRMVWIQVGPDDYGDPSEYSGGWDNGWVEVSNDEAVGIAGDNASWSGGDHDCYPIIRYRISKPRALLDLIQLISDLPAPAAPIKTDGVIA